MTADAAALAHLLVRVGVLDDLDPDHMAVRERLLANPALYDQVRERLAAVGFELVQFLGRLGVRPARAAELGQEAPLRQTLGMNAAHVRLVVWLWTQLVYRQIQALRHDVEAEPMPGDEQMALELLGEGDEGATEAAQSVPFERTSDYRRRLERLGMGPSYLKLLCTPQGHVASLCERPPGELFDMLFDIMGGKDVLDEWQQLAADYAAAERAQGEQRRELDRAHDRLDGLRRRLEVHERYLGLRRRALVDERALALADVEELRGKVAQTNDEIAARSGAAQEADGSAARERQARAALHEEVEESKRRRAQLASAVRELRGRAEDLDRSLAEARTDLLELERLRGEVADTPEGDLDTLRATAEALRVEEAQLRMRTAAVEVQTVALRAELDEVERGVLPPPEGVEAFRDELNRRGIPHHLLMDLVAPSGDDPSVRSALESWLGDLRFAVAVPDVAAFRTTVEIARREEFRFHVLAPDVRSPPPKTGDHPLLEAVSVADPRYAGLVRRLLRSVALLPDGEVVDDTLRGPGVRAKVSSNGYVLERLGGVYRGADRHFLGRQALERRKAELAQALGELAGEARAIEAQHLATTGRIEEAERAVRREERRRQWLDRRAEFERLQARERELLAERERVAAEVGQADTDKDRLHEEEKRLLSSAGGAEERLRQAEARAAEERGAVDALEEERAAAGKALADALQEAQATEAQLAEQPQSLQEEVRTRARDGAVAIREALRQAQQTLSGYSEDDRDDQLPGNVRTQERQVSEVGAELERLAQQVDDAKAAADLAYEQYRNATHRLFRRYFARLRQEADRIRFQVEGRLQARDDGRFEIDLKVGVGDKPPVPYRSSSLSGGQRAALSILMGMTTLQEQGVAPAGASGGFFLIDEPFSASDTAKIRELGAFLERTGSQFLVSMPTSMDIRSCGGWLRGVWTCTQMPGGFAEDGSPMLAPQVRCSYVERPT